MSSAGKHFIATPESTGGAGTHFEGRMQTFLAVLMLCDGELSIIPHAKIVKLQFQVGSEGFGTDDLCVLLRDSSERAIRALVQIKRSVQYVPSNSEFKKMFTAAWRDFNSDSFSKESDVIVFLTGPLSLSDSGKLGWLCNQARKMGASKFKSTILCSPLHMSKKRKFYADLKDMIDAEEGPVDDERIWMFLRRLYEIQPDSKYEGVLSDSLALALLSKKYGNANGRLVFDAIKSLMDEYNECGGEISVDELEKMLEGRGLRACPDDLTSCEHYEIAGLENVKRTGNLCRADVLGLLSLVGMWQEQQAADRQMLCNLLSVDDKQLDEIIQVFSQDVGSLDAKNGVVSVKDRRLIWRKNAPSISQSQIESYIALVKTEFKKLDTSLDADDYLSANSARHSGFASPIMREGLARGLAMLAVDSNYCKRLDYDFRKGVGQHFVRELLDGKDWRTWATLDEVLPYISEIDPQEFLVSLRKFVERRKSGLTELYDHESGGVFARSHMTGLIRALETLIWLPSVFAETANVVVEMVKRDPGGNWNPRPIDVFRRAMQPIAPHTWAAPKKRLAIVKSLVKSCKGDVAWKLISGLLPTTFYSFIVTDNHPLYRANNRSTNVGHRKINDVYIEFDYYSRIAIELSGVDPVRICELLGQAYHCWKLQCFEELIAHIEKNRPAISGEGMFEIWRSAREVIFRASCERERKPGAKDKMPVKLGRVIKFEREIRPSDPRLSSRILFSWRDCLYGKRIEELDDEEIRRRQEAAVSELRSKYGVLETVKFARATDKSEFVGYLLGRIATVEDDEKLFPTFFQSNQSEDYWVIEGYVSARYESGGREWVDSLDAKKWSDDERAQLLTMLPFKGEVWSIVDNLLHDAKGLYWKKVRQCQVASAEELAMAVDGFLSVGRGFGAIDLLGRWLDKDVDCLPFCRAIMSHFSAQKVTDKPTSLTNHYIPCIIKCIQSSQATPEEEKIAAEWMFIDLASDRDGQGFKPLTMNTRLANDPRYFCEALSIAYLPEKQAAEIKRQREDAPLSEPEKRQIEQVWKLLDNWDVVPGVDEKGVFRPQVFRKWVKEAFAIARKMDRLSIAKRVLARALVNPPKADDGLWMEHTIAKEMEKKGNEAMLHAYGIALYNSRGVHVVDKSGQEDKELAKKYLDMADAAENYQYNGIARELRTLAEYIKGDMYRMREEDEELTAYIEAHTEERKTSEAMVNDDDD